MKNTSDRIDDIAKETTSLLEQYEEQTKDADIHAYSEVFHHDYGDYSDSCCC